jgi:hypothetical protein
MSDYYGVIGNRDYIKYQGDKRPFWEFLDHQPDGWLTSLVYMREDLPPNKRMMFDCGAWSYRNEEQPKVGKNLVTPEWALEQYLQKASAGDFVIAPDHMLIPGADLNARRTFNRESAQAFLRIAQDSGFVPIAVVHGMDLPERIQTARLYVGMGYTALSLGGLAARASQKALILDMVSQIRLAVSSVWLHVLGLSSPDYAAAWHELNIQSFDGSSHFKQAFTAGTFYYESGGNLEKHKAARTERGNPDAVLEEITAPLCDCKACRLLRNDGVDTRTYGSNEHNMGRAAHNLNMLMRAQHIAVNGITVLVSCVGKKQDRASPAGDLYQSDWFKKARAYAETVGNRWYILSAKHGLLDPSQAIEPYEMTLNTMDSPTRQKWARRVLCQIADNIPTGKVIILAGRRYREFLRSPMQDRGYSVEVPMEGLGIGQQLAWLNSQLITQLEMF